MTLMTLGGVPFEAYPFNTHEYAESGSVPFVEKAVIGGKPPKEFVGEDNEELTINGKLLPIKLGGLDTLDMVKQMKSSGQPQFLMRGDGKPLGWFVICKLNAKSTYLTDQGIGQVVEFDIALSESGSPTAEDYFLSILDFL